MGWVGFRLTFKTLSPARLYLFYNFNYHLGFEELPQLVFLHLGYETCYNCGYMGKFFVSTSTTPEVWNFLHVWSILGFQVRWFRKRAFKTYTWGGKFYPVVVSSHLAHLLNRNMKQIVSHQGCDLFLIRLNVKYNILFIIS